jgi:hypothetical protein
VESSPQHQACQWSAASENVPVRSTTDVGCDDSAAATDSNREVAKTTQTELNDTVACQLLVVEESKEPSVVALLAAKLDGEANQALPCAANGAGGAAAGQPPQTELELADVIPAQGESSITTERCPGASLGPASTLPADLTGPDSEKPAEKTSPNSGAAAAKVVKGSAKQIRDKKLAKIAAAKPGKVVAAHETPLAPVAVCILPATVSCAAAHEAPACGMDASEGPATHAVDVFPKAAESWSATLCPAPLQQIGDANESAHQPSEQTGRLGEHALATPCHTAPAAETADDLPASPLRAACAATEAQAATSPAAEASSESRVCGAEHTAAPATEHSAEASDAEGAVALTAAPADEADEAARIAPAAETAAARTTQASADAAVGPGLAEPELPVAQDDAAHEPHCATLSAPSRTVPETAGPVMEVVAEGRKSTRQPRVDDAIQDHVEEAHGDCATGDVDSECGECTLADDLLLDEAGPPGHRQSSQYARLIQEQVAALREKADLVVNPVDVSPVAGAAPALPAAVLVADCPPGEEYRGDNTTKAAASAEECGYVTRGFEETYDEDDNFGPGNRAVTPSEGPSGGDVQERNDDSVAGGASAAASYVDNKEDALGAVPMRPLSCVDAANIRDRDQNGCTDEQPEDRSGPFSDRHEPYPAWSPTPHSDQAYSEAQAREQEQAWQREQQQREVEEAQQEALREHEEHLRAERIAQQIKAQQEALRAQGEEQLRARRKEAQLREEQLRANQQRLEEQRAEEMRLRKLEEERLRAQVPPYTRPVPELYSNSFPEDWGKMAVYTSTGFWATPIELFENHRTCEKRTTPPLQTHNIYSYHIRAGQQDIKVFAPHQALAELRKTPLQRACLDGTKELEEFWTSTVCAYEHKIAGMQHYLRQLPEKEALKYEACKAEMKAENEKLQADLAASKEKESFSQKRADNLMTRVGKSHIKRDWQQTQISSDFPAGEDLRNEFQTAFLNFESFACDAINCLEDLQLENPGEAFVCQVMSSLFEATKEHVKSRLDAKKAQLKQLYGVEVPKDGLANDDSVPRLFWYQTQQVQFPAEIRAITDEQIFALMQQADQLILVLHQRMLQAAEEGLVDAGEQNLRIPQLVRHLLRLHTITALSDPRCYMFPAPGEKVNYNDTMHSEILSPGVKRYGRIKEGDQVEVVLCGLYFEPKWANPKPVIPCLVRRVVADVK